jgi:hypothetical protein
MSAELLKSQQAAAQRAHDRMMTMLITFDATQSMKINDAKFLAEMARTYAFDACKDVEKAGDQPA